MHPKVEKSDISYSENQRLDTMYLGEEIAEQPAMDEISDINASEKSLMTIDEHLSELRKTIIHIFVIVLCFAISAFIGKEWVFRVVFAPAQSDFILYRWINSILDTFGFSSLWIDKFSIQMINTELSSQFMTHISMSFYFGLLAASPYVIYKLFGFVRPALYEKEKRHAIPIVLTIYFLFLIGLLMNYFVIFPISFRFLGTYQVDSMVINTISLSSYISSFTLLSLTMGLVFEIPILASILGKMGLITAKMLSKYRHFAFVGIMVVAALITPPDIFSLILMTIPLYGLYEVSIGVLKFTQKAK
ncbi:MAG: twin-arginine translocase subunit TatC [Bacteroides sp.]|nr:twin-arginine translocase subunit TatC [Ruminococcus flavefaciens]MCM1554880.1 twin-arginine translocase subunit TatC [Bacteroides sp.]